MSEQTRTLLSNTTLECSACISVCAPSGQGIESLKTKLFELARETKSDALDLSARQEHFRLAIDRRFSVRGAGTVVTGAVFAGSIAVGDTIRLLPGGQTSRIREIHANGQQSERVTVGQRAALNLTNIETADIHRGDWITASEVDVVTSCLDARVRLLNSENKPLRHWAPVHFHAGALNVTGRLALYNARTISPGEECYAQLVIDKPIHLLFGDRFVLRDQSATRTIGGGFVLDPFASRHRSFRKSRVPVLEALDTRNHDKALVNALSVSPDGLPAHSFRQARNRTEQDFERALQRCGITRFTDSNGAKRLIERSIEESGRIKILNELSRFHRENPQLAGIATEPLRQHCELPVLVFEFMLQSMIRNGELARIASDIKLSIHEVTLGEDDQLLLDQLLESLTPDTTKPAPLAELADKLGMDREILASRLAPLEASGQIIRVSRNRLFHPQALTRLADLVRNLAESSNNQGFDARSFRDLSGIGRNLSIDVLEYFDRTGLTRRTDDLRHLK